MKQVFSKHKQLFCAVAVIIIFDVIMWLGNMQRRYVGVTVHRIQIIVFIA